MNETRKMYEIRRSRGDFDRYLKGNGLDVGCGCDVLKVSRGAVTGVNEDGEELRRFQGEAFDFVYSSHCLEHLHSIETAVLNWSRVLKGGGFLYVVVPDWVIYEKQLWPSLFNGDHKHTFSLDYTRDMVQRENHWHIHTDFKSLLEANGLELISAQLEDFRYDYGNPDVDQTLTTDYAVCQICIIARKKGRESHRPIPYVEFGGGLGDIINQMFKTPNYRYFETITEKTAALLITHNPHAGELFHHHPNKDLIEIRVEPWVFPHEAHEKIRRPLQRQGYVRVHPPERPGSPVNLYLSPEDRMVLENHAHHQAPNGYAVIQPYAGTLERDLPPEVVNAAMEHLVSRHGLKCVLVGRSYERPGAPHKHEQGEPFRVAAGNQHDVVNLIDRLAVPGTIEAVRGCRIFFGSHSSMNIAAWHYQKPCVVLYHETTRERHFMRVDEWSFGKDYPATRHGLFDEFSLEMLDQVLT